MRSGAGNGKWYPLPGTTMRFFFNSLTKTISPDSGHLVHNPLATPSRDFTFTLEYFGLLKKDIFESLVYPCPRVATSTNPTPRSISALAQASSVAPVV